MRARCFAPCARGLCLCLVSDDRVEQCGSAGSGVCAFWASLQPKRETRWLILSIDAHSVHINLKQGRPILAVGEPSAADRVR